MNGFRFALVAAALFLVAGADDHRPSKAPSPEQKGKAFEWKTQGGLPFEYIIPESYDPKVGANLVVVLHGNGLDYRWTFWNHPPGEFRPDDVVVSLEGPTFLQSTNAFEFLAGHDECAKVHAALEELKKTFKVKQTFLYGHSQGSFFVFEYAGEFPDDVDGVVGHAGALWMSSKLGKFGHRQAIAFLHGTDDANVPWHQSVSGRKAYRDADYPNVHLRTLWDWPHAPVWEQAQGELAWCEGMTSSDPARIASALATLLAVKDPPNLNVKLGLDPAAIFAVAARLESFTYETPAQKSAATKAKTLVDKVAKSIAADLDASLAKGKLTKVDGKPWLGMATRFLEDFDGVAACAAWAKAHDAELSAIDKTAESAGREFWQNADKEPAKALPAGLELLEKGWRNAGIREVATRLRDWSTKEKELKLPKKEAARITALVDAFERGRKEGFEAYEKRLRELSP